MPNGAAAQQTASEKTLGDASSRLRAAGASEAEVAEVFAKQWCLRRVGTTTEEPLSRTLSAEPGVGPSDVQWKTSLWYEPLQNIYYAMGTWTWLNHDYSSNVAHGCWNHGVGGLDAIGLRLSGGPYAFNSRASQLYFWGDPSLNDEADNYGITSITGDSATTNATEYGITYQRQDHVRPLDRVACAADWDFDMYGGEILMSFWRLDNTCSNAQVIPTNIHTWNSTSVNSIGAGLDSFSIGWTNAGSARSWEHHGEIGQVCGRDNSGGGGGTGSGDGSGSGNTPPPPPPPDAPIDYDRDDYSDLALFRRDCATGSTWSVKSGRTGTQLQAGTKYGGCNDIPLSGDYDGDGHTDLGLFRRDCTNGSTWWIKSSRTGTQLQAGTKYGGCTDIPAPADYDSDDYTDLALYRQDCADGSTWWIKSSRTGTQLHGGTKYGGCTDIPAPGDYDGDDYADLALYRQDCADGSAWWIKSSRTGNLIRGGYKYGGCTDIPAPGDYDGDESTDLALYRRDCSTGSTWWIKSSRAGTQLHGGTKYGGCKDIPAASNPATTG